MESMEIIDYLSSKLVFAAIFTMTSISFQSNSFKSEFFTPKFMHEMSPTTGVTLFDMKELKLVPYFSLSTLNKSLPIT